MNFYKKDNLAMIVERIDVEKLINEYGIERSRYGSSKSGTVIRGCCPFPDHEDKNPSFMIHIDGERKGKYYCSCSNGSLYDFVIRMENIDFKSSIEFLKSKLLGGSVGLSFDPDKVIEKINKIVNERINYDTEPPIIPACTRNHKMIAWYMNWKRNIEYRKALEIIKDDGLLWCVDDRRYFADEKSWGTEYENSIIIPLLDHNGKMVSWMAQFVDGRDRDKIFATGASIITAAPGLFKCISGGYKWALIVEGYWDAVKAWSYGYPAISVLSAWASDQQMDAIYANLDKIVVALDNDKAGRDGANKIQHKLGGRLEVKYFNIPHKDVLGRKLDVDDMSEDELEHYIDHSIDVVPD